MSMAFYLFPLSKSPFNETDVSYQLAQNRCVQEIIRIFLPEWPLSLAKCLAILSSS